MCIIHTKDLNKHCSKALQKQHLTPLQKRKIVEK